MRRRQPGPFRLGAAAFALITIAGVASAEPATAAQSPVALAGAAGSDSNDRLVYTHLALPHARYAEVYADGVASIIDPASGEQTMQRVPLRHTEAAPAGVLPAMPQLIAELAAGTPAVYQPDTVIVAYARGAAAPAATLRSLGVDRSAHLLGDAAAVDDPTSPLDLSHVYQLHLSRASVPNAVRALRSAPGVTFAEPAWQLTTEHTDPQPLPATAIPQATTQRDQQAADLPANAALTDSTQSLLNKPGVDAVPAFTQIADKFGQLPGQGEIITNVSLGGLTDASAVGNPNDPCNFWARAYGPTTIVQDGQRYLDWPGMPLIPTYTADPNATLNPTGEVCGADDPVLDEVGLDFSMMAPLPHDLQRPGHEGSGLTDLLGIAPGASYRLVEPATAGGSIADLDAAFVAAATQNPRPSVITASLGFGFDSSGFSGRFLEDDPLSEAIIHSIVHKLHIVVCLSAGDGLRTFTNAAVDPSGGSAATNTGNPVTDLNDIGLSGAPSVDPDSGAIDVGATTLDDIAADPPQYTGSPVQQAFPETRYDGFRTFASGYGSRVNIAAPGDNVISIAHASGGGPGDVQVLLNGGTSASAPEVAAAAAVVLQVARLTHNHALTADPVKVRDFLVNTGSAVAGVPQSDTDNHVGPQVDVGAAVQTLLAQAQQSTSPSVPRVAVVRRQPQSRLDGSFTTTTVPGAQIPLDPSALNDWLTIAPDWVGLPAHGVRYQLKAGDTQLATTAWARLQPTQILAAAGLPVVSTAPRSVTLTYTANWGANSLTASVPLTFGPSDGTSSYSLAPKTPLVERGPTIPVQYDISHLINVANPVLVVSEPGRIDPVTGFFFRAAYSVPLPVGSAGTVNIPVSALPGGGIYGIGIQQGPGGNGALDYSNFAYIRVAPTSDARPPAPLVDGGHFAEKPYGGEYNLTWDTSAVPGADGAIVEVSAAGPSVFNNLDTFNNPGGTQRDANGHDAGSISYAALPAVRGTVSISAAQAGLAATMNHAVRVFATHHGTVIGEASPVSTVTEDGVASADGGSPTGGFGVNQHGDDAFLTSNQQTSTGDNLASVQTFDQRTNTITNTIVSSADFYDTGGTASGGPGEFANGLGLYRDSTPSGTASEHTLNPTGTWTPPVGTVNNLAAPNQQTATTAFLSGANGPTGNYQVYSADLAANQNSSVYGIESKLSGFGFPFVTGFGSDNSTRTAIAGASDFFTSSSAPPTFVTVDLASGSLGSFTGVGIGSPEGLAIDSSTHTMLAPASASNTVGIYNLTTGTSTERSLGGFGYQAPAADEANHLFIVQELEGPDATNGVSNNNAASSILVLDEQGTVLQRLEKFNFFNTRVAINGDYIQPNTTTRHAYTLGPNGSQLAPFAY